MSRPCPSADSPPASRSRAKEANVIGKSARRDVARSSRVPRQQGCRYDRDTALRLHDQRTAAVQGCPPDLRCRVRDPASVHDVRPAGDREVVARPSEMAGREVALPEAWPGRQDLTRRRRGPRGRGRRPAGRHLNRCSASMSQAFSLPGATDRSHANVLTCVRGSAGRGAAAGRRPQFRRNE